MDDTRQDYQARRDIWKDYNERQQFEHQLIDRKTTWWLTTQTILIAAYGIGFRGEASSFRRVVAGAGLAIAVISLIGVSALINSKYQSWKHYNRFYGPNGELLPEPLCGRQLQWGVDTKNTLITLLPDVAIPIVFLCAWLVVIGAQVNCGPS